MNPSTDVRPSALAGRWYPADPARLASTVDDHLARASLPEISGEILGVVSPHAGHQYSGPVAGYAFAALQGMTPDLVVILSPLHQPPARGSVLTTAHGAYQTPLGTLPVDRDLLSLVNHNLQEADLEAISELSQDEEHAIEILLPFLQRSLDKDFQILPLMLHQLNLEAAQKLAGILSEQLADKDILLVASTDLSHFYPAREADRLDQRIIEEIVNLNPRGIYQAEQEGKGYACGKDALAAVLWTAKNLGANRARHLKHSHSGEITGDNSRVVGYEAAVLLRE